MKLEQPDQRELQALAIMASQKDGQTILAYLNRAAQKLMAASCRTDNDAASRQMQGAWLALEDFVSKANSARDQLSQQEKS